MRKRIFTNKGMTLVELVVAMGIFLVVITIAVGAFVSLIRLQTQSETITDVQQNGRVALEQITRISRQADEMKIYENSTTPLIDSIGFKTGTTNICFKVDSNRLRKYNTYDCTGSGFTLTSDDVKVNKFDFNLSSGIPPGLSMEIEVCPNVTTCAQQDILPLYTLSLLTGLK